MTTNMIAIYLVIIVAWTQGADGTSEKEQVVWSGPCSRQCKCISLLKFCIPVKTYTFQVPYNQLVHRGVKISDQADVKNDIVYVMPGQITIDNSWGNEVVDSGKQWVPKATTEQAKKWAGRLILIQTPTHLSVTVNMKNQPNLTECSLFRLYWYTTGKDPYCDIILCSVAVTHEQTVVSALGARAKQQGLTVIDTDKMDPSDFMHIATGVNATTNAWVGQAVGVAATVKRDCVVCMTARPQLLLVNALPVNESCAHILANKTGNRRLCTAYQAAFPKLPTKTQPPVFTVPTDAIFTCYHITTCQPNTKCTDVGRVPSTLCNKTIELKGNGMLTTQRQDVWWWCGGNILRGHMEASGTGSCAYVSLIWPATVVTTPPRRGARGRREIASSPVVLLPVAPDTTYLDAIGVPRGVPDEYKLVDQIATGFENLPLISAVFPVTPNKNVDRINYLHFQMQRLTNLTHNLGQSLGSQLHHTSLMAWQTRMAVDMLLAERGGVCSMFGDQCCTFI
uniref:Envelope protein n=1 Tax=Neogobius melanostomus TaxID=47308 RepID=A0A8C6V8H4_9GOBI